MGKLSLLLIGALFGSLLIFTACGNDDDNGPVPTPTPSPNDSLDIKVISENIAGNVIWYSDTVYELAGRIAVVDGATLTIEAGTIIKGRAGTGTNATALLVARGARLYAEGTADAPIIFTSSSDYISPDDIAEGNFQSPNLEPTFNGLWGGLIVLGKAPISASAEEVQIEGIPTTDTNGLYGGTDENDTSGVIRYVSIRHGGANIGSGNEINGLTLGAVGRGTIVDNIEIVSNQDDGIEWFGGTVNVSNALIWNVGDDGMDTDQAWSGTCDNFIVITPGDHNFELDGPEGNTLLDVQHTFINGTVVHAEIDALGVIKSAEDIINTDDNSGVILENIFITVIPSGATVNESTFENVDFINVVFDVDPNNLSDYFASGTVPAGVTAGSTGAKADASVFDWTYAGQAGALADL